MAYWTKTKVNHNGAKNGGGYWGTRRVQAKKEIKE